MNLIPEDVKQHLYTQLCETSESAIFILDKQGHYCALNNTFIELMGFDRDFFLGKPISIFPRELLSNASQLLFDNLKSRLNETSKVSDKITVINRWGYPLRLQYSVQKTQDHNNQVYYLGVLKQLENKDNYQHSISLLNFDRITGLPHKQFFMIKTGELLLQQSHSLILARLNIDRYRLIKSSLGQTKVDMITVEFVKRISQLHLRGLRLFSHFGADDFAFLFESADSEQTRSELEQVIHTLQSPFVSGEQLIYIHASIGVSCHPEHGNQVNTLLDAAEKALQQAKNEGGDRIHWYSHAISNLSSQYLQLEAELRQAIELKQFIAVYQPKVHLITKQIHSVEALVRWQNPMLGLLEPKLFLAEIIEHKLSFELFCQMAQIAVQQLQDWQAKGIQTSICLNADAAEFRETQFVSFMQELLSSSNIRPESLHIEVTETSLMPDQDKVKSQLQALKDMSVCLSLDDFGTGYASLSYLQAYPFDYLKIDKTFIHNLNNSPRQQAIVNAIIDMATALNLKTIAEGIENQDQFQMLLEMGCDYGQGYWFGKPLHIDDVNALLKTQNDPTDDANCN